MVAPSAILLDTDVFSGLFIAPERAARRGLPIKAWTDATSGSILLISFQTRAEVLAGVRASNWSPVRASQAVSRLDTAPTVPADRDVIDAYATLYSSCREAGHALHEKIHTADRWIAACAIAKDLPLLARDHIFEGAPGLSLL